MVLAQVAENETRKSQDEEETGGDGVELPSLRKCIAYPRFDQVGNAADDEVQDDEFEQSQPEGFGRAFQGNRAQQAFVKKRKVGGDRRQQDHKPA